jgi:hypothetical protein
MVALLPVSPFHAVVLRCSAVQSYAACVWGVCVFT